MIIHPPPHDIIKSPPLMSRDAPVMYAARSDARNATSSATSHGSQMREIGKLPRYASSRSGVTFSRTISVLTRPGHTALTVMPNGANSFAVARVRPRIPAFAAV